MNMLRKLLPGTMALCVGLALAAASVHAAPGAQRVGKQAAAQGAVRCLATSSRDNAMGAEATSTARRARGLPPVRANAKLAEAAARHACDMARRGIMSHRGSGTAGPGQRVRAAGYAPRITAENIAAGPFSQASVHAAWEASRGHLANILIPEIRDYGVGRAIGADGKTEYWAAVYGAPRGHRR